MTAQSPSGWGTAWLESLGRQDGLDEAALRRGRTSTQIGRVAEIDIEPGVIRAEVAGAERYSGAPYLAQIAVASLSVAAWDRLVTDVSRQATMAAGLLAGELPIELADALLPAPGEASCDCTCTASRDVCVHAAALCHAMAALVDLDPFSLMLIRGRDRSEVLTDVRARRAALLGVANAEADGSPRGNDPGTSASGAWRREPEPLVSSPRVPLEPGTLMRLASPPPTGSGVSQTELAALVADAASRAHAMLTEDAPSGLALSVGSDVVRRAASGDVEQISAATKVPLGELASAAQAWRVGGAAGLHASRNGWSPPEAALEPGLNALGPGAKARRNTVSREGTQLRLDEQGRWWRFVTDDDLGWALASKPADDPEDLL